MSGEARQIAYMIDAAPEKWAATDHWLWSDAASLAVWIANETCSLKVCPLVINPYCNTPDISSETVWWRPSWLGRRTIWKAVQRFQLRTKVDSADAIRAALARARGETT